MGWSSPCSPTSTAGGRPARARAGGPEGVRHRRHPRRPRLDPPAQGGAGHAGAGAVQGARKPFARVLKKLRRRLGPLRDQDVMLEHLAELARQSEAAARRPLAGRAPGARAVGRPRGGEGASRARPTCWPRSASWWGLREEVAEAREAVDSLLAESLHLQLDAFAEQADLIAAQERRRRPRAKATAKAGGGGRGDPTRTSCASPARPCATRWRWPRSRATTCRPAWPRRSRRCRSRWGLARLRRADREGDGGLHRDDAGPPRRRRPGGACWSWPGSRCSGRPRSCRSSPSLWASRGPDLAATIRSAFPLTPSLQEARKAAAGAAAGAEAAAQATVEAAAPAEAGGAAAGGASEPKTGPGPTGSASPPAPAAPAPGEPSAA